MASLMRMPLLMLIAAHFSTQLYSAPTIIPASTPPLNRDNPGGDDGLSDAELGAGSSERDDTRLCQRGEA